MKKTVKNLITWSPSHLITSPKSASTLANNDSTYGCATTTGFGSGAYCTKLIQMNNWKIPNDYPYSF